MEKEERGVGVETRKGERLESLRLNVARRVQSLPDDQLQTLAKIVQRTPHVRGALNQVLRQPPVPPVLKQGIRRANKAWRIGLALAHATEEELGRRCGFRRDKELTLRAIFNSARWVEEHVGADAAGLWLAGLAYFTEGHPRYILIEPFLVADIDWGCKGLEPLRPARADAEVVEQIAAAIRNHADLPENPGWDVAVDEWLKLIEGVRKVNEQTESLLQWMFGSARERLNEPAVGELPDLPAWPGHDPVNLSNDDLPLLVDALIDAGHIAADTIAGKLKLGYEPDGADLMAIWRVCELGRQLRAAAGETGGTLSTLRTLAVELTAPPERSLLERLTAVQSANGADEIVPTLRAAAARALDTGEHADELSRLAELIDQETPPSYSDLHPLLAALPPELLAAIVATSTGSLTLPDLDTPEEVRADDLGPPKVHHDEPTYQLAGQHGAVPAPVDEDQEFAPLADEIRHFAEQAAVVGFEADHASAAHTGDDGTHQTAALPLPDKLKPAEVVKVDDIPKTPHLDRGVGGEPTVGGAAVAHTLVPLVVAKTDVLTDADPIDDQAADDKPDPERVATLLRDILTNDTTTVEHRAASGYWVTRAADGDERQQTAFETLAYASAMRRDGGPAGSSFDRVSTRLPVEVITDDRTARILAVGAALRATLVAPYTARSFLDALAVRYESQPDLHAIMEAVLKASIEGVQVGTAAPPGFDVASEATDRVAKLSAQAAELLKVGPTRNLGYHAATRVWQRWIDRDSGWLGKLLTAAEDDRRGAADMVREELRQLDDGELLERITTTDKEERGHKSVPIEYHGRDTLLRRTRTHLELIDDWLDTVDSRRAADRPGPSYPERVIAELRKTISARRTGAFDELRDTGEDALADAAAHLIVGMLTDVFDRLAQGRRYTGREPDPASRWLARPLLRTDVPLNPDTWQPLAQLEIDQLAVLADPPSFADAFARRLDRGDVDEAAAIATLMTVDDATGGEDLQQRLHEATIAAQQRATERWADARTELAVAKREGYLDATEATVYDQRLNALNLSATAEDLVREAGVVTDIGEALRDIEQLRHDLAASRRKQISLRRRDVEELALSDPRVAHVLDELLRLVDAGQLALAEERINQVVAGIAPPKPVTPMWATGTLTRIFETAVAPDVQLAEQVRTGGNWNGLRVDRLDDAARARAATAVGGWLALASRKPGERTGHVASVLTSLGLDLPAGRPVSVPGGRTAGRHAWFAVTGAAARGAPVPQFGSMARGAFQVLVTPAGTSPDQALRIIDDEASHSPTIHLHLGPWSAEQRRDYAAGLRRHHLAEILPVDATVFTARVVAADDESWTTTCALALPYAAANPYIIDTAGPLLPPEMFFGRTDEVRALLNPTGPTIVFGGRQLGKTALLKQVAARHAGHGESSVSVYLDIKMIGQNGDAGEVWGKLHHELDHAGVTMPTVKRTDVLEVVVDTGVRAWLGADTSRRLLILLDEADHFLAADRQASFAQVHKLKSLMDITERRCKVIFAGLHQVGRFQRDPNHPFAHLGRPIGVGGLKPQDAHDLLAEPLAALGYEPVDPDVLLRAVTYANYHPAILQQFGHRLVEQLQSNVSDGPPPWPVTHQDIQAVFNDAPFASWVAGLVDITLQLDKRYAVLAYAMAAVEQERGEITPLNAQEIMRHCASYGATAFNQQGREHEIVALLDELVHLGVLRQPSSGRWQLRSRYVTRMLGDVDEILQRLQHAIDDARNTWQEFDPAVHRRRFESNRHRIFPLTDRQLETICAPHPSYQVLVGSDALGIGDVREALTEATAPSPTTKTYERKLTRRAGSLRPPDSDDQLHRVVVADVRDCSAAQVRRATAQAAAWASDTTIVGSTSTLVLVDAHRLDVLHELLDERLAARPNAATLTSLQRMDARGIELWAHTAEADIAGAGAAHAVMEATGGWTSLVAQAARHAAVTSSLFHVAALHVADQLTDPAVASAFVDSTGVGLLGGPTLTAWTVLVSYGEVKHKDYEDELTRVLGGQHMRQIAIRERQLLELLGVVTVTDKTIAPEPVLEAAWQRRKAKDK